MRRCRTGDSLNRMPVARYPGNGRGFTIREDSVTGARSYSTHIDLQRLHAFERLSTSGLVIVPRGMDAIGAGSRSGSCRRVATRRAPV